MFFNRKELDKPMQEKGLPATVEVIDYDAQLAGLKIRAKEIETRRDQIIPAREEFALGAIINRNEISIKALAELDREDEELRKEAVTIDAARRRAEVLKVEQQAALDAADRARRIAASEIDAKALHQLLAAVDDGFFAAAQALREVEAAAKRLASHRIVSLERAQRVHLGRTVNGAALAVGLERFLELGPPISRGHALPLAMTNSWLIGPIVSDAVHTTADRIEALEKLRGATGDDEVPRLGTAPDNDSEADAA